MPRFGANQSRKYREIKGEGGLKMEMEMEGQNEQKEKQK